MDYYKKLWYHKNEKEIEENKYLIMLDLDKKELKSISKKDRMVEKYMEELVKLNENPTFREYMTAEEDARKIYNTEISEAIEKGFNKGIEQGIEQGKKQGIEQGKNQGKSEIISTLLSKGISLKEVSDLTGLSDKKIEKLKPNK